MKLLSSFTMATLCVAGLVGCPASVPVRDVPIVMADGRSLTLREEPIAAPTGPGIGFSLQKSATTPERRFVTWRPREGEAYPSMVVGPEGESTDWRRLILSDPALPGYGWEFVGPVGTTEALFGLLDSGIGSPCFEIVIVGSPDYGRTWFDRGRLRKPDARARVEQVSVDVFNNGRVSLRLDWADDLEARVGRYHYDTKDGGKSFAPPIYEPLP